MSETRLEITLDEIDLEIKTKETIRKLVQTVINKANTELGTADQTVVNIPNTEISIVGNNKQSIKDKAIITKRSKSKKPSTEESLQATGLDDIIKKYIIDKKKGCVKKTNVNDIIKGCLNTNVKDLNIESQKKVVDRILENRDLASIHNCEYSSTLLIKEGSKDNVDIENWYAGIIRMLVELSERVDVDKSIYDLLSVEQRQYISKAMGKLRDKINKAILKCK